MNADEHIESYVAEVAVRLPRRQRNDVAFELKSLLHEELADRAEAAGRPADAALATELLLAFGRPEEVAARYRPTLTIIDPADGHAFLRATLVGLAVIWLLGLWESLSLAPPGASWLTVLGHWWTHTVMPSPWWPGVLVVWYGLAAWSRRRRPRSAEWSLRAPDRIHGGRPAAVLGILGILIGLSVLVEPRRLLDVLWQGRAAPAAYQALTYTESFRHQQGPWLLALLLSHVPLLLIVLIQGRWSTPVRRVHSALALLTCVVLVWAVLGGPAFEATVSDRALKLAMAATVVFTLLTFGWQWLRRVRPAPPLG